MRRHALLLYIVLAYTFSWVIAVPLALSVQGKLGLTLPLALHYLTAYGPMLAALIVTHLTDGTEGVRSLVSRLTRWRIGWGWLLFTAFSPVALFVLIALVAVAIGKPAPTIQQLGTVNFLPNLGLAAWLLWIFNSGIGEEVGWRGFALPRLQQRHNALVATLILGVVWAFWHLPFFFYLPNFRAMGLVGFPGFAFSILAAALVFTWLFNSTRGSLLATALWHGAFNFISASAAGSGPVAIAMSIVVMVWAILLIFLFKPATLSHLPKQVAG